MVDVLAAGAMHERSRGDNVALVELTPDRDLFIIGCAGVLFTGESFAKGIHTVSFRSQETEKLAQEHCFLSFWGLARAQGSQFLNTAPQPLEDLRNSLSTAKTLVS